MLRQIWHKNVLIEMIKYAVYIIHATLNGHARAISQRHFRPVSVSNYGISEKISGQYLICIVHFKAITHCEAAKL